MSVVLDRLIALLDLERIDENIFRGQNEARGLTRLFGGQVAAQSLAAAGRTVEGRTPHSLHAYFLRGGDPQVPVVFTVDRIRDGTSFTTRRVVAVQHGRAIFNMSVSFHNDEESYEHQVERPEAPPPDSVPTWEERAEQAGDRIPKHLRAYMKSEKPIEMRSVEAPSWFGAEPSEGPNLVWLRSNGRLPDDPMLHHCLLAFASDMGLVDNIYRPHVGKGQRDVMMASLDHAMWFHRPFRMDEWLLYVQESPTAYGARGFVRGSLFSESGSLVCSVSQEGLMRRIDPNRIADAHRAKPPERD